ncbi:hypothetical protein JAO78_016130 [Alishewanella sp. 16-MA]|uniref:Uncharacterized protein n=1 Tax=Alishewanella maricola TaxID=2795740 RepID=A0ABS8C7N0_9ALTE|nr:hypothetical protein [Alishewanella maricola]MCB5228334.1 hypothetical protein [Alishewanella maricola]
MEILEKNEHLGNVVSRNNLDSLILKIDNNRAAIEAGLSFLTSADSYLFTIDSHSGNGDGMTSLLRFLYGKVIHTEQVLFVSAERCSQRIEQNTYRKMLIESSILFIDDVCYLYRKQQKTELWHQILQARISFQRKTLCTLCMSSEELKLLHRW